MLSIGPFISTKPSFILFSPTRREKEERRTVGEAQLKRMDLILFTLSTQTVRINTASIKHLVHVTCTTDFSVLTNVYQRACSSQQKVYSKNYQHSASVLLFGFFRACSLEWQLMQ